MPRPTRTSTAFAGAGLAALLVLGGCANSSGPVVVPGGPGTSSEATSTTPGGSASGSPSASQPTSAAPVRADVTISVDDGSGNATTTHLTCEPAGGDHPKPDDACAALAAAWPSAFQPVAKDMMCTEIYGGPETATVSGTIDGKPVDAHFKRNNGCEIHRWDQAQGLLGAGGSPSS
jgi:hypothetical protein